MKKYNKPLLIIEEIELVNSIANGLSSITESFGDLLKPGDKGVNFSEFGSGDWN